MTALPSDLAFADGSPISKSTLRALFSQRVPQSLANVAELRALTTGAANNFLLRSANLFYWCDTADTTSTDNGTTVIVSADGYRYKSITTSVADGTLTTAKLVDSAITTAKLAGGSVTFAKLATGAIAATGDAQAGTATNLLMTPALTAAAIAAQVTSESIVGAPQTISSPVNDVRFAFPAGYSFRKFTINFFNMVPSIADAVGVCLQFSTDSGATWFTSGADYNWTYAYIYATATPASQSSIGDSKLNLALYQGGTTNQKAGSGTIDIFDPLTPGTRKTVISQIMRSGRSADIYPIICVGAGSLESSVSACNMVKLYLVDSGNTQCTIASGVFFMTGIAF